MLVQLVEHDEGHLVLFVCFIIRSALKDFLHWGACSSSYTAMGVLTHLVSVNILRGHPGSLSGPVYAHPSHTATFLWVINRC